jgi:hypothetical protein
MRLGLLQRGTGAGFLRVLRFPLQILIPPTAPQSSVIRGWYNKPNSGRRTKWTQSHPPHELKYNFRGGNAVCILRGKNYLSMALQSFCWTLAAISVS